MYTSFLARITSFLWLCTIAYTKWIVTYPFIQNVTRPFTSFVWAGLFLSIVVACLFHNLMSYLSSRIHIEAKYEVITTQIYETIYSSSLAQCPIGWWFYYRLTGKNYFTGKSVLAKICNNMLLATEIKAILAWI